MSSAKKNAEFLLDLAAWAAVGACFGAANFYYRLAFTPRKHDSSLDDTPAEREWTQGREWMNNHPKREDIFLTSEDGLQLHANFIPQENEECHRYAICVHGYGDSAEGVGLFARQYYEAYGMHVLLPDLRGHGASEGNVVGMGLPDSGDLQRWIRWIVQQDRDAEIVMHGVSMGAAAILQATGKRLPSQVKAVVSDSAYTSAQDELRFQYNQKKHLIPTGLMMFFLRIVCRLRAKFDFFQASPVRAVEDSVTPTLFIHGEDDEVVPPSMMPRLFEAAGCKKEFLWIGGAGHIGAVIEDPDTYWARVEKFYKKLSPWILRDRENFEDQFAQ
ncbi:MAG: alpha/beta hydrolase [Lachnospiraceae bacterium]|nr:alpha/beta hydrolase [Lachnospiraceae bacterium]